MNKKRALTIFIALALSAAFIGCSDTSPHLDPAVTAPAILSPVPFTPVPEPTASPEPATPGPDDIPVTADPNGNIYDALGNVITDAQHYRQYLSFSDIRIYEYGGDTFMDLTVTNSYPERLICALRAEFYDEEGNILAVSSIQGPDGSFLLTLPSGSTPLYSTILTDAVLTDKIVVIIFDDNTQVAPVE